MSIFILLAPIPFFVAAGCAMRWLYTQSDAAACGFKWGIRALALFLFLGLVFGI